MVDNVASLENLHELEAQGYRRVLPPGHEEPAAAQHPATIGEIDRAERLEICR
jgi:hypothetical protein